MTDRFAIVVRISWFIAFLVTPYAGPPARAADRLAWVTADLDSEQPEPQIALIPMHGPTVIMRLPEELRNRTISIFGAEGKAVCGLTDRGIMKVEFNPLRKEIVPGTSEIGSIWSVTALKESGHIFVSGRDAKGGCGTFEIDPKAGTTRTIRSGPLPYCGGGGGAVSPDGTRIVNYRGGSLEVIELDSGVVRRIGGFAEGKPETSFSPAFSWRLASWSPNGRWISMADARGGIILIKGDNFADRKKIGHIESFSSMAWSPDSKYLLVVEDEPLLTRRSIKAVNVEKGKWSNIKDRLSHLTTNRSIGVVDASLMESATPLKQSQLRLTHAHAGSSFAAGRACRP